MRAFKVLGFLLLVLLTINTATALSAYNVADNFDDNSLDSGLWTLLTGTIPEQNQQLEFTGSSALRNKMEFTKFQTGGFNTSDIWDINFTYASTNANDDHHTVIFWDGSLRGGSSNYAGGGVHLDVRRYNSDFTISVDDGAGSQAICVNTTTISNGVDYAIDIRLNRTHIIHFKQDGVSKCTNVRYDNSSRWIGHYNRMVSTMTRESTAGGNMDDWSFSAINTTATPPAPGVASERLEQSSTLEQSGSTTINSNNYVSVLSGEVEITPSSPVYAVASIPITTASASNTAQCRITAEGTDYDSVQSRTNTAGASGHLSLMSNTSVVPPGNYTVNVECRRSAGTGTYTIQGASLTAHQLTTSGGVQLEFNYSNNTQATSTSVPLITQTLKTSENQTDTGFKRYLVAEWISAPSYSGNGNVTFTAEVAGVNCTPIKRYGSAGSTGSAGGSCVQPAPTNSTTYNVKLWATSPGVSISNTAKLTVKEVISHTLEARNTSLSGKSVTSSALAHIANLTITPNVLHDPANIVVRAGVSAQSDNNDSVTMSFKLVGGDNTSVITRTVNTGQPGVVVLDHVIENVTSATTIGLWASCSLNNCTINGGDLVAYLSDEDSIVANSFFINATDYYTGNAINTFDVNISGATLSTTTGSIEVVTESALLNISAPGTKTTDGTIAYFSNDTLNHDTTTNLSLTLRPYTLVLAKTGAGNPISNYSLNYTNGSVSYSGFTTTAGALYLPLFNDTYNLTIYDSPGSAKQTASLNLTSGQYLRNYTFTLLQSNSFNLSIYDEITNTLITGENFTVELISDVYSNNYTTTNGTLEVTLLTPSDYTIRYRSTSYTERDYIVTLSPQTYNTITLYAITINESSQLLAYVEDTGGDAVEGAQITLLRYFVDTNSYKIVEMAETSYAGEAGFWVQATEGFYKWSVNYNGQNEFLSSSPENIYTDTRIFVLDLSPSYYQSYTILPNIARSITVNYVTNALTFTWSDPSALTNRGCIYAEKLTGVQWASAGFNCALGSSGSVVLTPGNFSEERFKYWATIDTNTTYSSHVLLNGYTEIAQNLWNSLSGVGTPATNLGQFLAIGVITGMALLFSFSATAVLVVTAIALIFTNFLGLLPFSLQFITGMVALALGFGLYLMRR